MRLPNSLKADMSPMLYMPQTTERKIIGSATAFRRPRKVSRSGETIFCCSAVEIFAGNALMASPRTTAAMIAVSSFFYSGMLFFAGVYVIVLMPRAYFHLGRCPLLKSTFVRS